MKYPEHEKLDKIKDVSQSQGLFLEWLLSVKGYTLCTLEEENHEGFADYLPVWRSIEDLLSEMHGIDLDKLEAEKRQMLDEIRKENENGKSA